MKTNYVFGQTKFKSNIKAVKFFLYANLLKVTILLVLFLTSSSAFSQMSVTSTEIQSSCGDNGEIYLTVSGGVSPYTYSWNGVNGSAYGINKPAGSYSIVITDQNQNQITYNTTLSGPQAMSASFTNISASSCVSNDGSLTANVTGGTPPYTYSWTTLYCPNSQSNITCPDPDCGIGIYGSHYAHPLNPTQNTSTAVGLSPWDWTSTDVEGIYQCIIIDDNGCLLESWDTLMIISPLNGQFTNDITSLDISCNGQNDGEINLGVTGISYNWTEANSNFTSTSQNISNLQPGTYTVEVLTDPQYYHQTVPYCISTATITINEPAPLNVNIMQSGLDLQANVLGGTPSYTYFWNPNGEVTQSITPTVNGIYDVAVTDANGCQELGSFNVINTTTSINNMSVVGDFEVHPNPSTGIFNIQLSSDDMNDLEISVYNLSGELVYIDNSYNTEKIDLSALPSSVYFLEVKKNNTVFKKRVILQ